MTFLPYVEQACWNCLMIKTNFATCKQQAAMIDAGRHFVSATYYLEGDGPLVFNCYERLSALSHAIAIDSYPNLEAQSRHHANGNGPLYNQLVAQGKASINPGFCSINTNLVCSFMTQSVHSKLLDYAVPYKGNSFTPLQLQSKNLNYLGFSLMLKLLSLSKSFYYILPLLMVHKLKQKMGKCTGGHNITL